MHGAKGSKESCVTKLERCKGAQMDVRLWRHVDAREDALHGGDIELGLAHVVNMRLRCIHGGGQVKSSQSWDEWVRKQGGSPIPCIRDKYASSFSRNPR